VIGRALDPVSGRDRIRSTYPTASNLGVPWQAQIDSCCRIGILNNDPGGEYRVESDVDLINNGGSVVSSLPPIIPVSKKAATTFQVPGIDPDNNTLKYRLALPDEGGFGSTQPPGVSINATTGVYRVPAGLA